jgi:nucleotidyltransferase substrate binding protein (TIGR01987 family)
MTQGDLMIDLTPLAKALARLHESLAYLNSDAAQQDSALARQFQMATIQAFEFTYELAHKTLKRYLEATEPSRLVVEEMSFATLIRTAAERGLIKNSWDVWSAYRKARGTTSHTYNEEAAFDVLLHVPAFAEEVAFMLSTLDNKP